MKRINQLALYREDTYLVMIVLGRNGIRRCFGEFESLERF